MINKKEPIIVQAIRDSANDESCTLTLPGCRNDRRTVVWCHSPLLEDGKGAAQKADDIFGCYGCSHCHDLLDARQRLQGLSREEILSEFHRAMKRSWRRLWDRGIIGAK